MANVLDIALQNEEDGRAFYLKYADATKDRQTEKLFRSLAADEERHYQAILRMKELGKYDFETKDPMEDARKIFPPQTIDRETLDQKQNYLEAYEMALEFEKKSIAVYTEMAQNAGSDEEKKAFLRLVDEEESHRLIIWRLLQLLQRPEEWYPYLDFR